MQLFVSSTVLFRRCSSFYLERDIYVLFWLASYFLELLGKIQELLDAISYKYLPI